MDRGNTEIKKGRNEIEKQWLISKRSRVNAELVYQFHQFQGMPQRKERKEKRQ
jgi:hypothetical protein